MPDDARVTQPSATGAMRSAKATAAMQDQRNVTSTRAPCWRVDASRSGAVVHSIDNGPAQAAKRPWHALASDDVLSALNATRDDWRHRRGQKRLVPVRRQRAGQKRRRHGRGADRARSTTR